MVASLTATPTSPVKSLAISITSGSISNVVRGYRYTVESSGGVWKGTGSVRAAGTLNSTTLPIREISSGSIDFVSGDVVRVYDDVALGDKLVEDTSSFDPDGLAVSDNTHNPAPVVVSGGHWAGWLGSSGSVVVTFKGDESYTIDPDSSGTITHAWTTSSGTLSSATAANPTLTLTAAGKVLVTHTVTDSTNSKTRTQYLRLRVHDTNDPPYDCIVESVSASPADGWSLSVRLFQNATLTSLPDLGMVAIWTTDLIGSTEASFGTTVTGRGHIIMIGFLRRDTNVASHSFPQIRFDVISPGAKLAELPGFSKVFIREQSPDAWSEVKTLTIKRAIVQLAAFYTWLIEAGFDLIFDGFTDADYSFLTLNKDTPIGQWQELIKARFARIICLKNGRFEIQGLLQVVALASRAAITKTYTVTSDDVVVGANGEGGIEFTREHNEPIETFRLRGFVGNIAEPAAFFARFPKSPGIGNQSDVQEGAVVLTATEGYATCAMIGARHNRVTDVNRVSGVCGNVVLTQSTVERCSIKTLIHLEALRRGVVCHLCDSL